MRILLLLIVVIFFACSTSRKDQYTVNSMIKYSTDSDSALYYYRLGWQQIMDFGQYAQAEVSYRRSVAFDEDFLVAQSVLARLTRDLSERKLIYQRLINEGDELPADEAKVLAVYTALTHYTNLRDEELPNAGEARTRAFELGEVNLGQIVHRYPEEIYLKSEYIEVLHARYGPQQALDTLEAILLPSQSKNPFLLGYKAIMEAELEQYSEAISNAKQLEALLIDQNIPKAPAILADIYLRMGDTINAKAAVDQAYAIDSLNLDVVRLKKLIDPDVD